MRLPFMISRVLARVTALSNRAAIAFWRARASRSLRLELGDVGLVAAQDLLDLIHLGAQASAMSAAFWRSISAALARSSRSLRKRQLGLFGPVGL